MEIGAEALLGKMQSTLTALLNALDFCIKNKTSIQELVFLQSY